MSRGFVIIAQNTEEVDYINCALALAHSIKNVMPDEKVSLITDTTFSSELFDQVILFPHGDQCMNKNWKLANDWQVYDASPYELTIKLEADIFVPVNISWWWDHLKHRDLCLCTTIRNHYNDVSSVDYYRKFVVDNQLPNTYSAITYFKKSKVAEQFYIAVRHIFENWGAFRSLVKADPREIATTDFVYAIAASMIGPEKCTDPTFQDMSFVHMKQKIIESFYQDWTNEFLYEINQTSMRINCIPQRFPFHYHQKNFANEIIKELGINLK